MSIKPRLSLTQNSLSEIPALGESLSTDGAPVLIWIINQKGCIQFLEGDFPPHISLAPVKAIGQSLFEVLAEYPELIEKVRSALAGKITQLVTQNGSKHWEWRLYPLNGQKSAPTGVIGLAFDYSSQEQIWHQDALMNTAAALRKVHSPEEMPPVIVEQLVQLLGVDWAALALGSPPELKYSWGAPEGISGNGHFLEETLTDPEVFANLGENGGVDQKYLPGELKSSGIRGFQLIAHNELLGALWLGRREHFTGAEIRLITGIAEMATSALQRSGQHALTQRRLERLAALHSIDQAISGSFNLNLTLQVILEKVVSQLDVDAAAVFLVDPKTLKATYAEGRGFRHYQPQAGISQAREELVWRVLQKRELVAIPDLIKAAPTLHRGKMFAEEGFQSYFGIPLIAKGMILGVLEVFHRKPLQVDEEWFDFLRSLGTQAAIAMDNAALVEDLRRTNLKLDLAYNATLEGWVRALDLRDKCTGDHTHRVVERTVKLARAVGIPDQQLIHVNRGALLHDIGKLGVPDEILNKAGPLTEEEWVLMRKHPVFAREILEPIEFLRQALPIPSAHHEKWDGSGYPRGISGNEIPLEARVFAVIDVWDALSSPRPYRAAWPEKKIHSLIREGSGTHFDHQVVEAWERVFQIPG